jgi:general secretion pathway protein B
MSFILDALRKSEHARQKQTGPGFAEVPVVVAKPKTNVWATAAVALLLVNLIAVGVLLLRRANQEPPTPVATNEPAATTTIAAPGANSVEAPQAPAATPTTASGAGPTLASPAAPSTAPQTPVPSTPRAAQAGRNPLAEEVAETEASGVERSVAEAAAAVPAGPPAVTRQGSAPARRGGSVVYAPVPEADDAPYSPPPAAPRAEPASDGLPTADEVTARGGAPALHLDLHVYATSPAQRFIFVNSRKYREGDALQEGPVVEQITATGAVLSYRGSRFRLSND